MIVFRSLEEVRGRFGPAVVSIGNFDGCHIGHQQIFRAVSALANERGWKPSVLTFHPHPSKLLAPERAPKLLSTIEDRCLRMAQCGIEQLLVLPFTREIADLSPHEFAEQILAASLDARAVLVGENFRFGHKQAGDISTLADLGREFRFEARPVPPVSCRGGIVSSTEIRRLLQSGDVSHAARLLARFYSIDGNIVSGHGIGSKQTVPTLNLATEAEVLPANGVYVTRTTDIATGAVWPSITNIGYRPTFEGDALSIETFLLTGAPAQNPKAIQIEFTHRIRDERKFATPEALKAQILADVEKAHTWHRRYNKKLHAKFAKQ